ncbi:MULTISPECIES: LysR family transcriptional regulator [unclassified Virgibacillus]|uniref:LysR family transcriptional regulator n=1 Tax=unclassified Virgibacillus TaxID=2620237 RepID=UPI0024DE48DA|nr:LysR family transcriptional regulator [Virgibacillus sp. LDC-1]
MEIKHLQYFIEVTEVASFTKAAENLYITQPAISRIIKSLEDELGTPLFIRSRKKLALTDAGRVLYERAKHIEQEFLSLQEELDHLLTFKKGHIRIGIPSIVNSIFFSELIASFHKVYPEVTFQLEEDSSKGIEEKMLDAKLDFGVIVLPETHDAFDYVSFTEETLTLLVPASHRLTKKEAVELRDLEKESFILFTQDFTLRNMIVSACRDVGFQPKVISESSQLDFIEEMVAANLGITLLPDSVAQGLSSNVEALPVTDSSIEWKLAFIWRKDAHLSQVEKEFIKLTKDKLADTLS